METLKKISLTMLLLAMLPTLANAQEAGAFDMGSMDSVFGAGFKKLLSDDMIIKPGGAVEIRGAVELETEDFAIQCNSIKIDPETKVLTALGTPVKIVQGPYKAECQQFTYDMEKKVSKLEKKPVIINETEDGIVRSEAGMIIFFQDENGKVGIHFSREKNQRTMIQRIDKKPIKPDANNEDKPAEKIQGAAGLGKLEKALDFAQ